MKKINFALLLGFMASGLMAQPLAQHLYLSGVIGYQSTSTTTENSLFGLPTDPKFSSFQFAPAIGYTVSDNLMAGVRVAMVNGKSTSTAWSINFATGDTTSSEIESKTSSTMYGVFGRYYIPVGDGGRFFFYPDVNIALFSSGSESNASGTTTDGPQTNGFLVGVIPGFAFYPSTHWGIELHAGLLGFTSSTTEIESGTAGTPNQENKNTNFGFLANGYSTSVGVSFLLQLGG